MEFVFGNSGKSYGLLHHSNPRDEQISEYVQKINTFDVGSEEKLFTFKVVSDGLSFTAIFSLYAHDNNFGRGAFYNHVKWHEYTRSDFLKADFLDLMSSNFASQKDINILRETGTFTATNAADYPHKIGVDILHKIIYTLHSETDKKIAVAFPPLNDNNEQSTEIFRLYAKQIFACLPIDLRTTTSFVTSCDTDAILATDYRLGLLALSAVKKRNNDKLIVITADDTKFDLKDELAQYVKWIVSINENERNSFFSNYESNVVMGKISTVAALLKYYRNYIAPKIEPTKNNAELPILSGSKENNRNKKTEPKPEKPKIPEKPKQPPKNIVHKPIENSTISTIAKPSANIANVKNIASVNPAVYAQNPQYYWHIMNYDNGTFYIGEFVNGIICGWGVMFFPNLGYQAGEWKQNTYIKGVQSINGNFTTVNFPLQQPASRQKITKSWNWLRDSDRIRSDVGLAYSAVNGDWYVGGRYAHYAHYEHYAQKGIFQGWGTIFQKQNNTVFYGAWANGNLVDQKGFLALDIYGRPLKT